jgi:hypothetical protein
MGKKDDKKRHLDSKGKGSRGRIIHTEGVGQPGTGLVSKEERLRLKKKAKRDRLNKKKRERKQAALLVAGAESGTVKGHGGSSSGVVGALGVTHPGHKAATDARGPLAAQQRGGVEPFTATAAAAAATAGVGTRDVGRGKKLKRLKGWFPGAVQARWGG